MTVSDLIALLAQCDPKAPVTWEDDGMSVHSVAVAQCVTGDVELLGYDYPEISNDVSRFLAILRPRGTTPG
jgi:hypothetical protein